MKSRIGKDVIAEIDLEAVNFEYVLEVPSSRTPRRRIRPGGTNFMILGYLLYRSRDRQFNKYRGCGDCGEAL